MNPSSANPYHQSEIVFTGERQEFSDAGLSPDDATEGVGGNENGDLRCWPR